MKLPSAIVGGTALFLCIAAGQYAFPYDNAISPYGVCAHLPGEGDLYAELRAIKGAGIGWVRTDFSWSAVEPQKGSWTFARYDDVVRVSDSMQIGILPILCYNAAWGDTAWSHLDLWTAYVDTIVRRYKTSLRYWEVWNEENIAFWKDGTTQRAAHYVDLLQATWQAVKAVDPQLHVVIGGTSGVPYDYLDTLYADGARDFFDLMNVHPYRYPTPPEAASGSGLTLFGTLAKLRTLMNAQSDSSKPAWITEIGWPTQVPNIGLWAATIRCGLRAAGPKGRTWNVAFLDDADFPPCQAISLSDAELLTAVPGPGATVTRVRLDQLSALSAGGYQALIMPPGESFPDDYYEQIRSFVKTGGAVVFTSGVPLYYAVKENAQGMWTSSGAGSAYRQRLHFDFEAWWTNPAAPETTSSLIVNSPFADSIPLAAGTQGSRFLSRAFLKTGDTMTALITAQTAGYQAPVAAFIKYNSDSLRGAAVISTLPFNVSGVTPDRQAVLLPRAYLIGLQAGIQRFFWYEFQAPEMDSFYNEDNFGITHRDFSPKPAYTAYAALTRARPAGSVNVAGEWVSSDSTLYFPHWQRPDTRNGWAIWTLGNPRTVTCTFAGRIDSAFTHLGAAVSLQPQGTVLQLQTSENPLYIIGPQNMTFSPTAVRSPASASSGMQDEVKIINRQGILAVQVNREKIPCCEVSMYGLDGKRLCHSKLDVAAHGFLVLDKAITVRGSMAIIQVKSADLCLRKLVVVAR